MNDNVFYLSGKPNTVTSERAERIFAEKIDDAINTAHDMGANPFTIIALLNVVLTNETNKIIHANDTE